MSKCLQNHKVPWLWNLVSPVYFGEQISSLILVKMFRFYKFDYDSCSSYKNNSHWGATVSSSHLMCELGLQCSDLSPSLYNQVCASVSSECRALPESNSTFVKGLDSLYWERHLTTCSPEEQHNIMHNHLWVMKMSEFPLKYGIKEYSWKW